MRKEINNILEYYRNDNREDKDEWLLDELIGLLNKQKHKLAESWKNEKANINKELVHANNMIEYYHGHYKEKIQSLERVVESWKKEEELWNEQSKLITDFLTEHDDEYPQLSEVNAESIIRYAKGLQNRIFELDHLGTIAILENKKLFELVQNTVKAYNEESPIHNNLLIQLDKMNNFLLKKQP